MSAMHSKGTFNLKRKLKSIAVAAAMAATPILLSACQNLESTSMTTDAAFWQGMQDKLKSLSQISMSGRVKFSSPAQRFSANFQYTGASSSEYTLKLTSSVGTEIATIEVTPSVSNLRTGGRTISAEDPETLFAQATDMQLPLREFHNLLVGIAPNSYSSFSPEGILLQTQVPGFVIEYRNYMTVQNIALPSEIEVTGYNMHIMINPRTVQKLEFK